MKSPRPIGWRSPVLNCQGVAPSAGSEAQGDGFGGFEASCQDNLSGLGSWGGVLPVTYHPFALASHS